MTEEPDDTVVTSTTTPRLVAYLDKLVAWDRARAAAGGTLSMDQELVWVSDSDALWEAMTEDEQDAANEAVAPRRPRP